MQAVHAAAEGVASSGEAVMSAASGKGRESPNRPRGDEQARLLVLLSC